MLSLHRHIIYREMLRKVVKYLHSIEQVRICRPYVYRTTRRGLKHSAKRCSQEAHTISNTVKARKDLTLNKSRHLFTSRHVHVTWCERVCRHMLSRFDKPNMGHYAISQRSVEISAACDSLASGSAVALSCFRRSTRWQITNSLFFFTSGALVRWSQRQNLDSLETRPRSWLITTQTVLFSWGRRPGPS